MDSSRVTKSSSRASEPLDLESGLPTTPADVAAQRALRGRRVPGLLERLNELSAATAANVAPRRSIHEGCEPFRL